MAEEAPKFFGRLYDIERELQGLSIEDRLQGRLLKAKPMADLMREWLTKQRSLVPSGSATAKAIDYSLGR